MSGATLLRHDDCWKQSPLSIILNWMHAFLIRRICIFLSQTNCDVLLCGTCTRDSGPLCFWQVYLMTRLFCFARAESDGGFEEHFDGIWLSPAASHSLPCRGPQKGRHAQLSGLRKLFPPLRPEDYTLFTAGTKQHASRQSALWATLISVLQP